MDTLSPTALIAQLQWRYAAKKFDSARKIPADVWSALEEALILTPSSFGLQPWKFLVITDAAVKQSLVAASWRQTHSGLDVSAQRLAGADLASRITVGEVTKSSAT